MMEGLERDVDIVTQISKEEPVEDAQTNVDFDQVAYANGGTGLNPAIATGGNTLIIATGSAGTIAGNVTVAASQTLQGGVSTIPVRGLRSGTVANLAAPVSKPTVQTGGGNDVIFVGGSNVHIAGLTVDGLGQTSEDGIDIGSNKTNIVIDQNMFVDIGDDGLDVENDNSNLRFLNNTFTGIGEDPIDFEDGNTNVRIAGNAINVATATNDSNGIELEFLESNFTSTGNTITVAGPGADNDGIALESSNSNITITGNTIVVVSGNDGDAIELLGTNDTVTISGNRIAVGNVPDGDGVDVFFANDNVTISGNVISAAGNDGDAVDVAFSNGIPGLSTIVITGNTLSATGPDGEALDVGSFNVLEFSSNDVAGAFNDVVVDFDLSPNIVNCGSNTILPGTTFINVCEGNGNFTGTLEIIDNSAGPSNTITIVNAGAPCI